MQVSPIRKLYSFNAIDWNGHAQKVGYIATSEEDALAQLRAWRYREPQLTNSRHLRGRERPDIALHEAVNDPMVGVDWLPHLWAIPSSVAFSPRSVRSLLVKFAHPEPDFSIAQPHVRVTLHPNGGVRVGVGSADLLRALDPDATEVMHQLGWHKPETKYYRDFSRRFAPGWNLTYCLYQAIHALNVSTGIGPYNWFAIDQRALIDLNHFTDFQQASEDGRQLFRLSSDRPDRAHVVTAADEPIIRISTDDNPRRPAPHTSSKQEHPATPRETTNGRTRMTDNNYTALLFIIDRSGSMKRIKDDMIGGLDSLLQEQRAMPGLLTIDMVHFDNQVEFTHRMASPEQVSITLEPRGSTALHDAIGTGVNDFAQRIDALPEHAKPETIQVVVVTDGYENASVEYSADQIRELINEKQGDPRWDFVFLGANQDAVTTGGRLGFRADAAMTFSPASSEVNNATTSTSRYLRDRRRGERLGFTGEEREASNGESR